MKKVLITGTAGFIGFHLADILLSEGFVVHGYDGMTEYYDVKLKEHRHFLLSKKMNFYKTEGMLENSALIHEVIDEFRPEIIVHLAAQAGVRYSLENPRAYIESNVVGTFNIIEAARRFNVAHLLMASTSSVYGANESMPFQETEKADTQLTVYAATKKATESLGHSYAHLWKIPITIFRFFTVYGSWGRPDMALFKFTESIIDGKPIDIYNNGEMYRDFTYVEDLVRGIRLLMDVVPSTGNKACEEDNISPIAPFRIVNIGNSGKVKLIDFVQEIEYQIGKKAIRNYMPMQKGDVMATWANADLLYNLTGYKPRTDIKEGIQKFIAWYREYYNK